MPRLPDAALEQRIIAAATRLLDRGGEEAITLRAVAQEAGTSTPTIYQRFPDRATLMRRLIEQLTDGVMDILRPQPSIEAIFRRYLRYSQSHSMRVSLMVATFGARYVAGAKMPAFELLQSRITEEAGIKGRECEDLALAIASLGFGTAQGMVAAGVDSKHAAQFQRTAIQALRMLLAAFSPGKKSRVVAASARVKTAAKRVEEQIPRGLKAARNDKNK
jgi:AcrR family transcriptional regulator